MEPEISNFIHLQTQQPGTDQITFIRGCIGKKQPKLDEFKILDGEAERRRDAQVRVFIDLFQCLQLNSDFKHILSFKKKSGDKKKKPTIVIKIIH